MVRANLLAGLPTTRTLLKLFAAPIFFTGLLFLAAGLGYARMPRDMRIGEKLSAIGIAPGSALAHALLCAIGSGKVLCVVNHWAIKSDVLDVFFALAAAPGFGLVLAAHSTIRPPAPQAENIPPILVALMLMGLGYSSSRRREAEARARAPAPAPVGRAKKAK